MGGSANKKAANLHAPFLQKMRLRHPTIKVALVPFSSLVHQRVCILSTTLQPTTNITGFRYFLDKIDGYSMFFPDDWVEVKGRAPQPAPIGRHYMTEYVWFAGTN